MQVWKFPLGDSPGVATLKMPRDTQILSAHMQAGMLCMWGLVNPHGVTSERRFLIVGTGCHVPEFKQHIATVQDGRFVWHVFEVAL